MQRIVVITLLIVCSSVHISAQIDKTDIKINKLEEMKIEVKPLAKWGTRIFSYQIERNGRFETLGTVSMTTTVENNRVNFHDKWELDWRGNKIVFDLQLKCISSPILRPISISSKGKGDDEVKTFSATVGKKDAVIKENGAKDKTIDFPADTLTDIAMFRIFTLLPRNKGFTVKVGHTLEVSELNLKGNGMIVYEGEDSVTLNRKQLKLHKFIYKRGERIIEEAWVDDQGKLRRIRIDGRKILIETPSDK